MKGAILAKAISTWSEGGYPTPGTACRSVIWVIICACFLTQKMGKTRGHILPVRKDKGFHTSAQCRARYLVMLNQYELLWWFITMILLLLLEQYVGRKLLK